MLAVRHVSHPLREKVVHMQVLGVSESKETQQAGRLVVINLFSLDEESQRACIREPTGGVTLIYLSNFGVLLNFIICYVVVWTPHCDAVKKCRRERLGWWWRFLWESLFLHCGGSCCSSRLQRSRRC